MKLVLNNKPLFRRLDKYCLSVNDLTNKQALAISRFLSGIDRGDVSFDENPCVCGSKDDILIAKCDRFGIPLTTVLCRNCGIMRSDPYYDSDSIIRFYQENYRDIYTGHRDTANFFEYQNNKGNRIATWLSQLSGSFSKVFEVGCGAGGVLYPFQQKGSQVYGCDFNLDYLKYGRMMGLDLAVGESNVLAKFGRANLIILCQVIEHLLNPIAELNYLRSLMEPDGIIYIEVPGIFRIREIYHDPALFFQNAHVWHFCLGTLDFMMGLAGFERILGNENVWAVYRNDPKNKSLKNCPNGRIHWRIIIAMGYFDYFRYWPRMRIIKVYLKRLRSKYFSSLS